MDPPQKLDPMTEMALRSLHDIVMPPAVSWMPQTWGWALLAALLLALLLAVLLRAYLRYRRNAYRREALRELGRIETMMRDPARGDDAARELAELVKRTALAAWPRSRIAALTGSDWVRFLDASGSHEEGLARLLDDLEYCGDERLAAALPSTADEAIAGARRWIETHHVST